RHRAVHHRRLYPTPAAVAVLMPDRPFASGSDRPSAKQMKRKTVPKLEQAIGEQKEVVERKGADRFADVKLASACGIPVELPGRDARGGLGARTMLHQDEQRDHRATRPARHLVDAEAAASRHEHQLGRQRRYRAPGHLAEVSQEDLAEHAGALESAALEYEFA